MATIVDDGESYGAWPSSPASSGARVATTAAAATAALIGCALAQLPVWPGPEPEPIPAGALSGQADEDYWPSSAQQRPQAAALCVRLPYLPDPDEIPSADLGGIVSNGWGTTSQSTTGGNLTPGLPAGFLAGDIHVCAVTAIDNGATPSMPAGWTLKLDSGVLGGLHLWLFWHRAAGGDTGPTVTYTGILAAAATISGWRGCVGFGDPFDAVGTAQSFTAQSVLTVNSITTTRKDDALLCFVAAAAADTFSTYAGAAPIAAYSGNETGLSWSLQYKPDVSAAGATGTSSVTPSASATGLGVQVSLLQTAEWMDEDFWSSGVQPVPAALFREPLYLPDPEQEPAGHFAAPSSTKMEEDYEILEFTGPPQPVPASLFQKLPYLPDADDAPAGKLFGQPDEDYWQSGVAPSAAALYRSLPYLPDPEEVPAGFVPNPLFCAVAISSLNSGASIDGSSWQRGQLPAALSWNAIAWNGKVFCALASGSAICATSPDGITWTAQSLPVSASWTGIAWNGKVFCAIASGGTVAATSPTGESLTWILQALPSSASWNAIAWSGSVFCAVAGNSTSAATSPDGVTWTPQTLPSSPTWWALAWNGSVFCVVASNGNSAATSPDGATWTPRTTALSLGARDIAWNGAVFCAVEAGSSGNVATSADGISWATHSLPSADAWEAIAWDGSVFCVVANLTSKAATSPDGTTWTAQALPANDFWQNIAASYLPVDEYYWQNPVAPVPATLYRSPLAVLDNEELPAGSLTVGAFLVAVSAGPTGRSPDHGGSWASSSSVGGSYNGIAWNGKVFCTVTRNSNTALTSPDGIIWTPGTLPNSLDWQDVAWNGQVFCAITGNAAGGAATSSDGLTWSNAGNNLANRDWRRIVWNGKVFCVVARNSSVAATSPDGVTWTEQALPASAVWYALAWNGTVFSAIAQGTTQAATSTDGASWTSRTMSSASTWRAMVAKGNTFCAVDATNIASVSTDGISWVEHALPFSATWTHIGHDGVVFCAVANSSAQAATSPDGTTWTTRNLPFTTGAFGSAVTSNAQLEEEYLAQINRPPAPVPATLYQRLPLLWDPEELPAGVLSGQPDEDFWINPVAPVAASLFQRLPLLPDPEEIAAGSLAGQFEDDSWWLGPRAVPAALYQLLPINKDPEEIPAGVLRGQYEDDSWPPSLGPAPIQALLRALYLPDPEELPAGALGATSFVAVANSSNIPASSIDGAIWNARTIPGSPAPAWSDVAWNGLLFCAVGSSSTPGGINAATSPDGITWTTLTLPNDDSWAAICWNGTVFCAVSANNNHAATSPDGVNWSSHAMPSGSWRAVAASPAGRIVAVAQSGTTHIASSDDNGSTWTARTDPLSATWHSIAWGGSAFCALSGFGSNSITSGDGITWAGHSGVLPAAGNWRGLAWSGEAFCAVDAGVSDGGSAIAATSPDGISWAQQTLPQSVVWYDVAWNGRTFCAIAGAPSATAVAATSPNGAVWTQQAMPLSNNWEAIAAAFLPGPIMGEEGYYWQNPVPPVPAALFQRLPYLPDPEELPAGALSGQPDEDFWALVLSPPAPVPATLYQRLPLLWDPEQEPAGKLHGPEEFYWQNPTAPVPAALLVRLPLGDPEELPAGTLSGQPDEDYDVRALVGAPAPAAAVLYQPLPINKDPEEIPAGSLFGVPEELYWQNGPFPAAATIYQRLPLLWDPEEFVPPAGAIDEDLWALVLGPPSTPAILWRSTIKLDPEEIPAGQLAGQPDEDYWKNPVPPVPASLVVPWAPADAGEIFAAGVPATVGAAPCSATTSEPKGSAIGSLRAIFDFWLPKPPPPAPPLPEYREQPPWPAWARSSPATARTMVVSLGARGAVAVVPAASPGLQALSSAAPGWASGAALAVTKAAAPALTKASPAAARGAARLAGARPARKPAPPAGRAAARCAPVTASAACAPGGASAAAAVAASWAGADSSPGRVAVQAAAAQASSSCAPGGAQAWTGPSDEEVLMLATALFGDLGGANLEKKKAAALPKTIDRDRPSVERARAVVGKIASSFFRAAAREVAAGARANKVQKAGSGPTAPGELDSVVGELEWQKLRDALQEELEKTALEAAQLGLDQVGASVQIALGQVNDLAVAWAQEHAGELVTNIEETTRDFVRDVVSRAVEDGWSWEELARELRDSPAFSDSRADMIARTEVAYADVQGNLLAWGASGLVAGKQWIVAQDNVCDDCDALDGEVVQLDEQFSDGSDGPPEHPNCRCDVVPVLLGDEEQELEQPAEGEGAAEEEA